MAIPAPRICVLIPAFNEAGAVGRVVAEVQLCLPAATAVVVDDGSTDDTTACALRAGATVVRLPINLGIGGAMQTGYRYALGRGFAVCIQVDGDGQHDPAELRRLMDPIVAGAADLVIGSRWLGRGDYVAPAGRRLGMRVLSLLLRWRTSAHLTDPTSGFRAVGSRGIELFARSYPTDFPEVQAIALAIDASMTVTEVPTRMRPRVQGRSSIGGLRSFYYMARVTMSLMVERLDGAGP